MKKSTSKPLRQDVVIPFTGGYVLVAEDATIKTSVKEEKDVIVLGIEVCAYGPIKKKKSRKVKK